MCGWATIRNQLGQLCLGKQGSCQVTCSCLSQCQSVLAQKYYCSEHAVICSWLHCSYNKVVLIKCPYIKSTLYHTWPIMQGGSFGCIHNVVITDKHYTASWVRMISTTLCWSANWILWSLALMQGGPFGFIHDVLVTDEHYIVLENPIKMNFRKLLGKYAFAKACLAECLEYQAGKPTKIHIITRPGKRSSVLGMTHPGGIVNLLLRCCWLIINVTLEIVFKLPRLQHFWSMGFSHLFPAAWLDGVEVSCLYSWCVNGGDHRFSAATQPHVTGLTVPQGIIVKFNLMAYLHGISWHLMGLGNGKH